MIRKYFIFLGICCWIWGCNNNAEQVRKIDIRNVEKSSVLKWSQFASEERFVRLETNDESLLDDYFQVWIGNKYIITYGNDDIHQFTTDGRHIRRLATYGRGPGEYQSIMTLTVDEERERLYFSDFASESVIHVLNLENGKAETSLPITYGVPVKMVFAEDSVLYCMPLRLKDTEYELYRLSVSGHFLGGVKRTDQKENSFIHNSFLEVNGNKISCLYGVTDTLYHLTGDQKDPAYCFQTGRKFKEYTVGEKADRVEVILESPKILLVNHNYIKVSDPGFGAKVITYDEDRDPEVYVLNKEIEQITKVSALYLDVWGKEMKEYNLNVSGMFVCQIFNAIQFREMIKDPDAPYHHWHEEMTNEDNPVLLIGKIRE